MKYLAPALLIGLALLNPAESRGQQLPPDLLMDETFQQARHYWVGRIPNLVGEITATGYSFQSLGTTFSNIPIEPYGPALNQQQDFVIEGELRGQGSFGVYWGGQRVGTAEQLTTTQLNLALAAPTATVFRLQAGAWTMLATMPLPTAVAPADWHTIRIARAGAEVTYWVDGHQVLRQPWPNPPGPDFGLTVESGGAVTLRRLRLWHHHPIRLAPGLPATLKRERLEAPSLNTERYEVTPLVSADGRFLYFSRVMGNYNALDDAIAFNSDVYVAERNSDGSWGHVQALGPPINTAASDYPQHVSPDGQTLLINNRYGPDGNLLGPGLSRTRHLPDGTWTVPEALPEGTGYRPDFARRNSTYCLDASGTILLRSASLTTALGNTDLYLCRRQPDGSWSAPALLPAPINTPAREVSPFLAPDGKTLYFASDGHPGYGGLDIFMSTRLDDTWTRWSEPLNLGPSINTPLGDSYYSTSAAGDVAYLVSDTGPGHLGDIFRVVLPAALKPAPAVLVRGRVLDARTGQAITTAEVRYEQLPTGTEAGVVLPAVAGSFEATLPAGQQYGLRATAPGYLSVNESLNLTTATKYGQVTQDLYLMPLTAPTEALAAKATALQVARPAAAAVPRQLSGVAVAPPVAIAAAAEEHIALNNLFFVRGKAELLPASFPELNRLAQTLTEHPGLEIRLDGHTDNTGDAKDPKPNQVLSEQRTQAVKAYLVRQKIAPARLSTRGYGGSRPVAANDTEANKARNRRVEFVIVKR
ncbi:OmpA family protein [Hymenobacter sp. M29]|uniref:OmpA family protein n=1 Tax=Hymenobacter mellowenesis TaxID=3063995 RepID=A0ABT9A644_9BACT|nr:OmpA family protein [Hymenobacter sp. M29]MDO7845321.1 OmpA family protein [Hymenobacter sp. M29]